ncbi:hypothetical protein ACPPVT_20660 [Angustibacter sp. McL0619]|uniref:hypothetical protein n=1 Tax=Angustibacter sp. McL0619 TaxID=3415676 RepID=UPI003CF59C7A
MTDQPQRPDEAGQTQPLGESQPTVPQPEAAPPAPSQPAPPQPAPSQPAPSQPTPSQPAPSQPAPSQQFDPLAAPPAGVQGQPALSPRKSGPSLPTSTLAMLGVALLVVGGVIGALIGHNVGGDDTQANARGNFSNGRGGYGFPGGGQAPQNRQQGQGQQGQAQPGQGVGPAGRGLAAGTVTAVDGDTVTIKQANGNTVKVKLGDSTTYTLTQKGTKDDVKVGQPVVVTGQTGSDGLIAANSVRTGEQFVLNQRSN